MQFIKPRMDETAAELQLTTKEERFPLAEMGSSGPQPPPLLLFSDETDRRKHLGRHQNASAEDEGS